MNNHGQQRVFSFSCHQSLMSQQNEAAVPSNASPAIGKLSEYINPGSDKAPRVLMAHNQRVHQHNRRYEESYKTVMCQNWLEKAQCNFGKNCRFAHGFEELRHSTVPLPINSKYKTRPCEKYTQRGVCPYGTRCLFIHPEPDNLQMLSSFGQSSPLTSRTLNPLMPEDRRQPFAMKQQPLSQAFNNAIGNGHSYFAASLPAFMPSKNEPFARQNVLGKSRSRNLLPQIEKELLHEREQQRQAESKTDEVKFLEEAEDEDKENNPPAGQVHSDGGSEQINKQFNAKFVFSASSSSVLGTSMGTITNVPPPPAPMHVLPKKKWSELEFDPVEREMELIVDKLVSSPLIEGKHIKDKE